MQGIRIKGNLEKIGGDEEKSVPPFISFGMGGVRFYGQCNRVGRLGGFHGRDHANHGRTLQESQ